MRYRSQYFPLLLIGLYVLLSATFALAQDAPAPQFLYRDENHLVLLNGYTGEATELPLVVTDQDRFAWSPDGQYLLARLQDSEHDGYFCLNLYDVDGQKWLYNQPISCSVGEAIFSGDGTRIYYVTTDETSATLWRYNMDNKTTRELYYADGGDTIHEVGISDIRWSPTKTYLTFVSYRWIMGGTLNTFVVVNAETEHHTTLSAPETYYASYYPTWSADDRWFLITLMEEYVTSGTLPVTNNEGDVYLVNSDTGASSRLTYTPAEREINIHWTEDGKIAFTEIVEQKMIFTLEQALNVEAVPLDQIVIPPPVDYNDFINPLQGVMVSPDARLGGWVNEMQQGNDVTYELDFGSLLSEVRTANFSVSIPYPYDSILIGWRPSDYPYPQG